MTTAFITHKAVLNHDVPEDNPEVPARIFAVLDAVSSDEFAGLMRVEAEPASLLQVQRCHAPDYIDMLHNSVPEEGFTQLDYDTFLAPESLKAAYLAAGAACQGVDLVMRRQAQNAFCAMRPPGHHAERAKAMGFCFLNAVAIAAAHAIDSYDEINRVAIVDFDVHHGNGTQDIFQSDPSVLYVSTHQMPLYPGTGKPEETGVGNIKNVAFEVYTSGDVYRKKFETEVIPAIEAFQPDLLLISAGFDAHADDPLGGMNLVEDDFIFLINRLVDMAEKFCEGRVVSVLEGGYNLSSLAECVASHVAVLNARGRV